MPQPIWKEQEEVAVLEHVFNKHKIVVHNDDHNTFDHVISCLIQVCLHTVEQAEQCTLLIHHKGKCNVKTGTYQDLEPKCSALLSRGLSAEIV